MADIHRRLASANFLRDMERSAFSSETGKVIGDVNYVHPFRDGNGRAQLQYLKQLAAQAGHPLDLTRIDAAAWIEASKQAHMARYDLMAKVIDDALRSSQRPR